MLHYHGTPITPGWCSDPVRAAHGYDAAEPATPAGALARVAEPACESALFGAEALQGRGVIPIVLSWGMGRDSTALLVRWLLDPSSRPPELLPDASNLVVVVAQTGDEWSLTIKLCEEYILPLLRRYRIRLVELARSGPARSDPVTVFQDTREPYVLHGDGDFKLSDEFRLNGVGPIASSRECSNKAKGYPQDWWRAREFGARQIVHAVGFNSAEVHRIVRDPAYGKVAQRRPIFPVCDWGWDWDDCGDYLMRLFGVLWPKSRCRMCPFAGSKKRGWPDTLSMYLQYPEEAFQHIIDEFCALCFNENAGIYAPGDSLGDRLRRDGADEVVGLAEREMEAMPWALYLVGRVYTAKALAPRLLVRVLEGPGPDAQAALSTLGDMLESEPVTIGGVPRVPVLTRQENRYPCPEMFCVAAPARALTKIGPHYPAAWRSISNARIMRRAKQTGEAIEAVYAASGSRLRAVDAIPATEEELTSAQQTLV